MLKNLISQKVSLLTRTIRGFSVCLMFLSLFFPFIIHGQNTTELDSLLGLYESQSDTAKLKTMNLLIDEYRNTDPNRAEEIVRECMQNAEVMKNQLWIARFYYRMGSIKKAKSEYDSSIYYHRIAEKMCLENKYDDLLVSTLSSVAESYEKSGEFEKGVEYLHRAIDKSREMGSKENEAMCLSFLSSTQRKQDQYTLAYHSQLQANRLYENLPNEVLRYADGYKNIGEIEYLRGNYKEAVSFYKKALGTYKAEEDWFYYGSTLNRIGASLIASEEYDDAASYFQEAKKLGEEKNYNYLIETANFSIANLQLCYKNFEEAKKGILPLHKIFVKHNEVNSIFNSLNMLGQCESGLGNFKQAEKYFNQGIYITDTLNSPDDTRYILKARSEMFAKANNYKKAYQDLEKVLTLKDSIDKINRLQIIEEMKIIHELEKKEKQIQLQQKDLEISKGKEEISKQRQRLTMLVSLFFLLLAASLIYAASQRNKKQKLLNEKLNETLEFKKKELTSHALHLAHKNEILHGLKKQITSIRNQGDPSGDYHRIIMDIDNESKGDRNWKDFLKHFEEVHKDFNTNALQKFPNVSANELKLLSLLRMNLNSKEIANILNISLEGVKKARYRLRKKMDLVTNESLEQRVMEI